mmetsp:Transcript_124173/g.356741  ORF Transcript_124173/g.356741 Transcript_124173/m.356741 type:complete len:204 (+) Transcript_124173:413-1024(+)
MGGVVEGNDAHTPREGRDVLQDRPRAQQAPNSIDARDGEAGAYGLGGGFEQNAGRWLARARRSVDVVVTRRREVDGSKDQLGVVVLVRTVPGALHVINEALRHLDQVLAHTALKPGPDLAVPAAVRVHVRAAARASHRVLGACVRQWERCGVTRAVGERAAHHGQGERAVPHLFGLGNHRIHCRPQELPPGVLVPNGHLLPAL